MLSKDISEEEISKLSPQQARLSSFSLEDKESLTCECEWQLPLHSSLKTLQTQLFEWMQKFEIFRTKIQCHKSGENVQVISPRVNLQLELCSAISDQLIKKKEWVRRNAIRNDRRCIGVLIYQINEERCGIYIVAPPEIADLETVQLLAKSVSRQMSNIVHPKQAELLQYADLSEWLNRLQDEELGKEGLRYWRKTDCPSIAEQSLLNEVNLKVEPHFSYVESDDYQLPSNNNANEAVFLSVWSLCIAKLSDSERITIGKLSSGRNLEDLKEAVGNLSLTLPVSFDLDWMETFSAFNERVAETLSEKEEYRECFKWTELKGANSSGAASYCFYGFEYFDLDEEMNGSDIRWVKASFHAEPHLLKCSVKKYNEKLYLSFSYHPGYYSSETVEHLSERYFKVLAQVSSDFEMKLSQLDFILPWEREKQQKWNQTEVQFEQVLPYHQLFEKQVDETPENVAITFQEKQLSYTQLNSKANQFARLLISEGVSTGDYVGLSLNRSIDLVVAVIGILKVGAAYVPIDPEYPVKRINYIAENSAIKIAIVNNKSTELFTVGNTLNIDDINKQKDKYQSDNIQLSVLSEQAAYIIYTSGSTGEPKGVVISHRSLYNYVQWAANEYKLVEGNGSLVHSSISFDLTVTSLLAPLSVGQSVILIPEKDSVEGLISRLSRNSDYTLLKITPSHLEMLNTALAPDELKDSLRVIVIGGEALSFDKIKPWLLHSPGTTIVNEYGPTEATVGCCVEKIHAYDRNLTGMVPIGRPIYNTKLHILDRWQNELPIGVTGELYIEGAGLALEYHKRPNMTSKAFIRKKDIHGISQQLYRTGDRARYFEDGRLSFAGRCDEQIKLRGYRIEPGEIETILRRHKGIEEAIVGLVDIGMPENTNEVLVAYVVKNSVKTPDLLTNLQQTLTKIIPEYMVPAHWVILDSLPLNKHGKLDKEKLPLPEKKQTYVPARTKIEQVLIDIWQRFLGVEQIGIKDNYFQLGGDSIRSISLISAAREQGITFTLNQLFSNPTVAELAQNIGENNEAEEECHTLPFELVEPECRAQFPDSIVDAYPLTTLQQGMIYHNQFYEEERLYHDIFSYRLQLPTTLNADQSVIRKAYNHLLKKHPVLRTTFALSEFNQPLQLVHKNGNAQSLVIKDLRDLDDEQQQAEIKLMIRREKEVGFDISRLPLLRCFINLLSEREVQFSISFHHSVIDGWSDAILLTELLTSIIGLSNKEKLSDRALSTKFSDFVKLELSALNNPEFKQFWRDKLCKLNYTRIPTQKKPPQNEMTSKVHSQNISISESLSERLKDVSRKIGVPLKTVLLAAHMRALNLIVTQGDITTCLVSAGRPVSEDGDHTLGLFINSIPLRIQFDLLRKSTWQNLIEETFKEENQCLKYRRYPYGKMKEFTGLDSVSDALFYFTDYHNLEGIYQQTGIKLLATMPYERSSFPLVIHFNVDPDSKLLSGEIECNASQFTLQQNDGYSRLYAELLEEISQSIDYEFDSIYANSKRKNIEPASLSIQQSFFYSDFVQWRRNYWLNQPGSEHLSYWKNRLSGCFRSPKLPLIDKRSQIQEFVEENVIATIETDLYASFSTLCIAHHISDSLLFECLFSLLLSRHSNENHILIRRITHYKTVKPGGAFTLKVFHSLASRMDFDGDTSFAELIKKCKEESIQDSQHNELLFESLVEHMKVSNANDELPTCQVFLSLNKETPRIKDSPRFINLPNQQEEGSTKFDLWLSIKQEKNKYELSLNYNAALYAKSNMQILVNGFAPLLREIAINVNSNVFSYSILPPEDELRLLARSPSKGSITQHEPCVHQMFERQASLHSSRTAIVGQGFKISYQELNEKANRLARYLNQKIDLKPESVVGIFLNGTVDFIVSTIALLKIGCTFVPLDPDYPAKRIQFMVEDAGLRLIITTRELNRLISASSEQFLCIDDEITQCDLMQFDCQNLATNLVSLDHEKLAYVIYTSGSTGKPKGVMVKHGSFSGHIAGMISFYRYSTEDRVLQFSSVGVDATQEQIFCSLSSGASLCVYSQKIMLGSEFDRFCAEQSITILDIPPAYIPVLFEKDSSTYNYLRNNIRLLILGGERLGLETYQKLIQTKLTCQLVNAYGPTEAVITSLAYDFYLNQPVSTSLPSVPIGRAMEGREIFVLNSSLALVPDGVSGELYIGGQYLSSGYLNRSDLTAESFIKNPFSEKPDDYIYKTGDTVQWCEGDNLCFIGRIDDQVNIRGFRVELSEVESELCNHPLVESSVVSLTSSPSTNGKMVAYVVPKSVNDADMNKISSEFELSDRLREYMQGRVPDYMVPAYFVFLDTLPLTSAGKIDREQLTELEPGTINNTYVPPRNELESMLCSVWKKVLKIECIGINSNFFHLGGDSLSCLQLVSQLRENKINLTVRDIFNAPTISELGDKMRLSEKNDITTKTKKEQSKSSLSNVTSSGRITSRITSGSNKNINKQSLAEKLILKID